MWHILNCVVDKWKSESESSSVMSYSLWPDDYTVHGILQGRILERVAFLFSRGSSQPMNPTLQVDSLPAEPQGKPKNTGVGSLSLLQGIFLTQDQTRVSSIAEGFLTNWAMRGATESVIKKKSQHAEV